MRTILRFIFRTLLGLSLLLLGLAIVIPVAAYFFFDPNDFKPQISTYLSDKTGLPLTIEGPMTFTLVPLGLKAEDITVEQAPHFGLKNFAHIKEMDLKIPLHDLLRKHLIIESLRIKDLDVHLVKQKNGQTNWEYYIQKLRSSHKNNAPVPAIAEHKKSTASQTLTFALEHFDVKNANVTFVDESANETWVASSLFLTGQHSKSIFPISIESNISRTPLNQCTTLLGKAKAKGQIALDKNKPWIDLDTSLVFEIPNTTWGRITLNATMKGDVNKQLEVQALKLKMGSTEVHGNLTLPMDPQSTVTFSLHANEFDLNPYLNAPKKASTSVSSTTTKIASQKAIKPVATSANATTERAFQGEFSVAKLHLKNVTLHQVKTKVNKKGANLSLKPLTANIFNGKLNINITHALASSRPTTLEGSVTGLSLQPILRSFNKPEKITGLANVNFNLAHHSATGLHGIIKCNVTQGTIQGVDVNYYLALAQSLLKKVTNSAPDTKQTTFQTLSATLNLHDNIIDNNDLTILSEDFSANGEGSIYLNDETLAYKLKASKVYHDGKEHPNALPLAIRIKGSIQNPKIEPDMDVYLKKLLNNEINQRLDQQLQKGLNKLLGDKEDAANPSTEGIVKEKLEKEVGRGLKKIFKLP